MSYTIWRKFSNGQDRTDDFDLKGLKKAWKETIEEDSVIEATCTDNSDQRVTHHFVKEV